LEGHSPRDRFSCEIIPTGDRSFELGRGLARGSYYVPESGGALLVDLRDVQVFMTLKPVGFVAVPSGPTASRPNTGLRVGLVFQDTTLGAFVRYDGAAWNAVTLT